MIEDLHNGILPALPPLRQRLQAAMIKKMAMMRLPREFHHNDPKINPNSEHMLWAAILLEDDDALAALVTILITEAHGRHAARRGAMDASPTPPELDEILSNSLLALLAASGTTKLNQIIKQKIKKTSVIKELPVIKI